MGKSIWDQSTLKQDGFSGENICYMRSLTLHLIPPTKTLSDCTVWDTKGDYSEECCTCLAILKTDLYQGMSTATEVWDSPFAKKTTSLRKFSYRPTLPVMNIFFLPNKNCINSLTMIFYHHKHGLPFRRSSPIIMRRGFQRTLILLILGGDIALNPGPGVSKWRQPKYPCTVCEKGITEPSKAVVCDFCERWTHIK